MISITPELEARVQESARAAGLSIEAYIESLIREDEEWDEREEPAMEEGHPDLKLSMRQ
jgi:hypothetical protein